jgi:hypothetical protein
MWSRDEETGSSANISPSIENSVFILKSNRLNASSKAAGSDEQLTSATQVENAIEGDGHYHPTWNGLRRCDWQMVPRAFNASLYPGKQLKDCNGATAFAELQPRRGDPCRAS